MASQLEFGFEESSVKRKAGTRKKRKQGETVTRLFHQELVLAQWALSFFGEGTFECLKRCLSDTKLEGVDPESGNTRFFLELTSRRYLIQLNKVSESEFRVYDRNIVRHWNEITAKRNDLEGRPLKMKYFQWLSLLVTELYLDYYFHRKEELLTELEQLLDIHNKDREDGGISPFAKDDLNKISFWEATGAGKTLLMHINIKQYLHYAEKRPSKIIVLTPNEGLSNQHVEEMRLSGFYAEILSEENELLAKNAEISIVDAGKLISDRSARKKGDKSLLAEAFEGDNLILVDEGHNGSTNENGERLRVREQLCRDGFAFEYSATFGQAVSKSKKLRDVYAKSILFDYSYKYFHDDGYGKEAVILNMPKTGTDEAPFNYLCACLLSFYQQRKIYRDSPNLVNQYGLENPLCVFVGNTVNTESSDVSILINFLANFLTRENDTLDEITKLINNDSDLVDSKGKNIFANSFLYLKNRFNGHDGANELFKDLRKDLFNADISGRIVVRHLSKSGEITLSVGTSEPFALINVGKADDCIKSLKEKSHTYDIESDAFSDSLFGRINEKDSTINFLVGSRKFTEGWNSWRVSTMGLLNMGRSEGTQIIQLFGRGVRLKGRDFSLRRSTLEERRNPETRNLDKLETLNIFGIRSNYMVQFKEYLEKEGIQTKDSILEIRFSTVKQAPHGVTLHTLAVKDGYRLNQKNGFKSQSITLFEISEADKKRIKTPKAELNEFSNVQKMITEKGIRDDEGKQKLEDTKIDPLAFHFFNWDTIYRELLKYKATQGYWNLSISRERIQTFCSQDKSWYTLYTHPANVTFDSFSKLSAIEATFKRLLFQYTDKFYKAFQSCYESEHMTTVEQNVDEIPEYIVEISEKDKDAFLWQERFKQLQKLIEAEDIPAIEGWGTGDLVAICFSQHLYSPLIYMNKNETYPFTLKPLPFDAPSEKQFVEDLQRFYDVHRRDWFEGKDLYLMRNASQKSKGIGFAQAGNFYPDFLLWIVDKKTNRQYLTFVDPKGLRNMREDSPKLNLYHEIKELEKHVRKTSEIDIILSSVILSATEFDDLLWNGTKEELEQKNIFFLADGGEKYISKLFKAVISV